MLASTQVVALWGLWFGGEGRYPYTILSYILYCQQWQRNLPSVWGTSPVWLEETSPPLLSGAKCCRQSSFANSSLGPFLYCKSWALTLVYPTGQLRQLSMWLSNQGRWTRESPGRENSRSTDVQETLNRAPHSPLPCCWCWETAQACCLGSFRM